jgi:hypothetical protein
MTAFIASFMFVVLAEMGDKTQLLAMAFATRYRPHKVLIAVFLATLANHSLAVIVGHFLSVVIPMDIISLVAAVSFVVFGLWTIRGDALQGEEKRESRFGPIATVGIAFFLAEMGDKSRRRVSEHAQRADGHHPRHGDSGRGRHRRRHRFVQAHSGENHQVDFRGRIRSLRFHRCLRDSVRAHRHGLYSSRSLRYGSLHRLGRSCPFAIAEEVG